MEEESISLDLFTVDLRYEFQVDEGGTGHAADVRAEGT